MQRVVWNIEHGLYEDMQEAEKNAKGFWELSDQEWEAVKRIVEE